MSAQNRPAEPDPVGLAVRGTIRPRMTPHEIEFMLAAAIRSQYVYLAAKERLSDINLFEADEAKYALVWRASAQAIDGLSGALPGDVTTAKEIVATHIASEVATDIPRRYYTPGVEHQVSGDGGLLDAIFALPIDKSIEDRGIALLAKFVTERKIGDPLRRALSGISATETLSDPGALITLLERHSLDLGGIGADPSSDAFIDTLDILPPGAQVSTTGIRGLDELLNGGHAPKEVYALLGPSSGGKSALASQIALEGAKIQSALAAEVGSDLAGHWYYFSWELTMHQLRARMYGYIARIHADTFQTDPITRRPVPLSTADDLATIKSYENDPYVNSPGNPIRGEKERLVAANRMMSGLNSRLRIVDYSASSPGGGHGGVDEIARFLHREKTRGRAVAGVVIDYAGLVVNRYCTHNRLKPSDEIPLLASFVNEVRSKVAIPYNCPGWVLHQLHGSVAKRAPGALPHYSDARGCKNFADNADFSIEMGNRNRSTGLLQIGSSKHRRAPGREDGVILKFDGRFGVFLEPDQIYVMDPMTKQFVPREFLGSMTARSVLGASGGGGEPPVDPRIGL